MPKYLTARRRTQYQVVSGASKTGGGQTIHGVSGNNRVGATRLILHLASMSTEGGLILFHHEREMGKYVSPCIREHLEVNRGQGQ